MPSQELLQVVAIVAAACSSIGTGVGIYLATSSRTRTDKTMEELSRAIHEVDDRSRDRHMTSKSLIADEEQRRKESVRDEAERRREAIKDVEERTNQSLNGMSAQLTQQYADLKGDIRALMALITSKHP